MSVLLLILQILGAMPSVIKFAQMVWDLIKQIRDKGERKAAKRKLYKMILRREHLKKLSVDDSAALLQELEELQDEVQGILTKEGV